MLHIEIRWCVHLPLKVFLLEKGRYGHYLPLRVLETKKQIKETVHVRLSMSRLLIQLLNSPKRIQIKRVLGAK